MCMLFLIALHCLLDCPLAMAQTNSGSTRSVSDTSTALQLNLRIVWGADAVADYSGNIQTTASKLACLQQLGIDPYDAGFLPEPSENRLQFQDPTTRFGGCDVMVQGQPQDQITFQIQCVELDSGKRVEKSFTWTLEELRDAVVVEELGLLNSRISISRVPGDRIRFASQRSHLIYHSDEALAFQLEPYALPWQGISCNLETTLIRLEDGAELMQQSQPIFLDEQGHAEPSQVLVSAPREQGVYELRCQIEPKRLIPKLLGKKSAIERTIQFVVANHAPSSLRLSDQASTELMPDENQGSNWRSIWNAPSDELEVQESGEITFPKIHGLKPGQMHRIKLTLERHHPRLRLVVRAPFDALNQRIDPSVESLIQKMIHPKESQGTEVVEYLFWPAAESVQLSLENESPMQQTGLVACSIEAWRIDSSQSESRTPRQGKSSAINVLELHRSDLRSMFASVRFAEAPYDDWQTSLHFANSLGSYCVENGIDRVVMVVDSEGGTIYPSELGASNCRNDTGTFSLNGRDPFRKDQVELLYRILSQYSVDFIPMLELGGPILELEKRIAKNDLQDILQGSISQARSEWMPKRLYNPASIRVQQAIADCINELHQRYHSHPSFQGVALRFHSDSHLSASVPLDQVNPAIRERFQADSLVKKARVFPTGASPNNDQMNAEFSDWMLASTLRFVHRHEKQIAFLSCSETIMAQLPQEVVNDPESPYRSPIHLDSDGTLARTPRRKMIENWNTHFPASNSFALSEPTHSLFRELVELNHLSHDFEAQRSKSVPQRDGSGSISKVRVWQSREAGGDLLISNAGAVDELIRLEWDTMPLAYQVLSSSDMNGSEYPDARKWINANPATAEWTVRVFAGDAIRVQFPASDATSDFAKESIAPKAISWSAFDPMIKQALGRALDILERSVNALHLPVRMENRIRNSGFETMKTGVIRGRLDGWTSALDSNTAISLDSQFAAEGTSSLRIDSNRDSASAWLQSDAFILPKSDRLMIGLKFAAIKLPNQAKLTLSRWSTRSERFELVATRDLSDLRSGPTNSKSWNDLQLDLSQEFSGLSYLDGQQTFRLQIETKGIAQFWIDDIFSSQEFLTADERRDIRSELFLAKASMQNGDIQPASNILTSPIIRLVKLDSLDLDQDQQPARPVSISKAVNPKEDPSAPSTLQAAPVITKPTFGRRLRNFWGHSTPPSK